MKVSTETRKKPSISPYKQSESINMTTDRIYAPIFLEHITAEQHVDKPERMQWAMDVLRGLNWLEREGLVQLAPRGATVDELAAVHERDYIQKVEAAARKVAEKQESGGRKTRFFATDTYISARSYEAAIKAAGAPITAIDAIMKGEIKNAYSLLRPPGYHAATASAIGFCLLNNVAV